MIDLTTVAHSLAVVAFFALGVYALYQTALARDGARRIADALEKGEEDDES